MKKVLFVFNSLGLGGSQKIEAFVANTIKNAGFDTSVISLTDVPVGVDLEKDIPIRYVVYSRKGTNISGILSRIAFLSRLRKAVKQEAPDIICVFLADKTRIVTLACSGMNIPIIGSERGAPGRHGSKLPKYNRAFKKCKYAVFQTETASSYYDLKDDQIKVIPNPCFLRWGEVDDLKNNANTICAAGRLCAQKRFDVLIDAFALVKKKHPEYTLYIYGSGDLQEKLQQQISKLSLENEVVFPGYVQDVFASHGRPDVFVLSSDYEGIPNILMEAMSLGIPCVSTDCEPGGAEMLFDHEKRGLLSPIGDSQKLADNICRVIEDRDLAVSLGSKAQEIKEVYSVRQIQQSWLDLFNSI